MDAVATFGLAKRYGRAEALRPLDLRVPAGKLFGFLGPNGAGKTTTIRILLGLLRPSAGRATILGRDAWYEGPAARAEIGYLAGDVRLWAGLTGRATIAFLNAARRASAEPEARRLAEVLRLDLDKRVRDYSHGMKQKLGLIAALMHRPKLLILDEPTSGLDPLVRAALFDELRAAVGEGRTVLLSSHTLAEVEELCDEVAILRGGELVEHDSIESLRRRAVRQVEVHLRPEAASGPALPAGLTVVEQSPARLRGTWAGPPAELLAWLAGSPVEDVTIAPPDLEDLFRAYYRGSAAEGGS